MFYHFYGTQLAIAKDRRCLKGVGKMAVNVKIPTALQRLTQGKGEVEGSPGRVIELIRDLERRFPGIGERILEEEKIRKFVNIYVNEEDIRTIGAEAAMVKDGDEVSIIPAIAGGV